MVNVHEMMVSEAFLPRWWKYGRPAPFWLKHVRVIETMIKEYQLEPVPMESLPHEVIELTGGEMMQPMALHAAAPSEELAVRLRPRPFPGGYPIAHLHFRDQIYLLDDLQWQEFSKGVVKEFRAKLGRARGIGFEQLIDLSNAIDPLG